MEAAPFRAAIEDRPDQRRHSLGIDAEGLGAAAHAHARALDFELRVHANGQAGPEAEAIGDPQGPIHFAFRLGVEGDPGANGRFQRQIPLAWPREGEVPGVRARPQCHAKLTRRGDVEAVRSEEHTSELQSIMSNSYYDYS